MNVGDADLNRFCSYSFIAKGAGLCSGREYGSLLSFISFGVESMACLPICLLDHWVFRSLDLGVSGSRLLFLGDMVGDWPVLLRDVDRPGEPLLPAAI